MNPIDPKVAEIAGKLTPSGREFITAMLWRSPRGATIGALAADASYRPALQIERLGLAERCNDRQGTNWFHLNELGLAVRQHLLTGKK